MPIGSWLFEPCTEYRHCSMQERHLVMRSVPHLQQASTERLASPSRGGGCMMDKCIDKSLLLLDLFCSPLALSNSSAKFSFSRRNHIPVSILQTDLLYLYSISTPSRPRLQTIMSSTSASFPTPTNHYTDAGDGTSDTQSGTDAGASGDSSKNSITLSTGGIIAIIVVVVVIALIGGKLMMRWGEAGKFLTTTM